MPIAEGSFLCTLPGKGKNGISAILFKLYSIFHSRGKEKNQSTIKRISENQRTRNTGHVQKNHHAFCSVSAVFFHGRMRQDYLFIGSPSNPGKYSSTDNLQSLV